MPRIHVRLCAFAGVLLLVLSGCKVGVEIGVRDENSATSTFEMRISRSDLQSFADLLESDGEDSALYDTDMGALLNARNCYDLLNALSDGEDEYRTADLKDNSTTEEISCSFTEELHLGEGSSELKHQGDEWVFSLGQDDFSDAFAPLFESEESYLFMQLLEQALWVTITMPAPITSVSWKDAAINGNSVTFDLYTSYQYDSDLVIYAREGADPIGDPSGIASPADPGMDSPLAKLGNIAEVFGTAGIVGIGLLLFILLWGILYVVAIVVTVVLLLSKKQGKAASRTSMQNTGYPSYPART